MGNDEKAKMPVIKVPTPSEIKAYIMICQNRILLQRNKKLQNIGKKKLEIANCLKENNLDVAKAKMDSLIREEDYITAYDILGPLLEILKERVTYIVSSVECPADIRAQLDSVIYASTRMEIEDLYKLRDLIMRKYGSAYIQKAENNVDKLVNINLVEKLKIKPSSDAFLIIRLKQLCKEKKIPFEFPSEIANDLPGADIGNPFGPGANPYGGGGDFNPYSSTQGNPFGGQQGGNPYGPPQGGNPYGPPQGGNFGPQQGGNPYGPPQGGNSYGPPQGDNPFASQQGGSPFGQQQGSNFGPQQGGNPYGPPQGDNPFVSQQGGQQNNNNNPYGPPQGGSDPNPYGPPGNSQMGGNMNNSNNPYGSMNNNNNNMENPFNSQMNNNNNNNSMNPNGAPDFLGGETILKTQPPPNDAMNNSNNPYSNNNNDNSNNPFNNSNPFENNNSSNPFANNNNNPYSNNNSMSNPFNQEGNNPYEQKGSQMNNNDGFPKGDTEEGNPYS